MMLVLDQLKFRHRPNDDPYTFTLTAMCGEIVGVMGASGSGKSTLLDLIAGFQRPLSGVLSWQDQNLIPLPPEDRPSTILFQKDNLFDHLSAFQNVVIGMSPARKVSAEDREIVSQALARVGLSGKGSQRASTLSGGQQQRVALARAIVRDQPVLLLDEPFNGLDDSTKLEMLALIEEQAAKADKCVVMVTHDATDCEAIATKRYLVDRSQLILN